MHTKANMKTKICHAFNRGAKTYDDNAILQQSIGIDLVEMALEHINDNANLVDIGCGTAPWTRIISNQNPSLNYFHLDIATNMLNTARNKHKGCRKHYISADFESLPLREKSIDYLFSNLALQWGTKNNKVTTELSRVHKPSGKLFISLFVENTLHELHSCIAEIIASSHQSILPNPSEFLSALIANGYHIIKTKSQTHHKIFDSAFKLIKSLKLIGANTCIHQALKISQMKLLNDLYSSKYSADNDIIATYESLIIIAEKQ